MDSISDIISAVLNSLPGHMATMIAAILIGVYIAQKLFPIGSNWEKYEGTIITSIKLAEKAIPDDTPNAGLRRLNEALKFVVNAWSELNAGKSPPADVVHDLKEGIQVKHAELERMGNLESS